MDSKKIQEEVEGGHKGYVYFLHVTIMYSTGEKKKRWHKKDVSLVSRYITPQDMMRDKITMSRVYKEAYPKSQKFMDARVVKVLDYKPVGTISML